MKFGSVGLRITDKKNGIGIGIGIGTGIWEKHRLGNGRYPGILR